MTSTKQSKIEETELYVRGRTTRPFSTVLDTLQQLSTEAGFRVLALHDVQATLAEKGLERGPMTIVEVCNARFAHQALGISNDVAMFMPCRFTLHTETEETVVTLSRPSMISGLIQHPELAKLADEVETKLKAVLVQATA